MSLVLREVLAHSAFEDADPRMLSGEDQLDHPVRWIHSADLYDIAPLLRGDEVLLTNGVGLVNTDETAQRTYVKRLADRSVAALFFEVGRTFAEVPPAMVDEARKLGLAMVVLQPVLRFTEVAEAINSEVIDRSVVRLRHADEISRTLSEALVRGATVSDIVRQVAEAVRSWAVLSDTADRVVATATSPEGEPPPAQVHGAGREVPIMIEGTAWGRLTLGAGAVPDVVVDAVRDRVPRVLELCLIREQPGVAAAFRVKQLLLEQLARGVLTSGSALEDSLRGSGMPTSGYDFACLVLDPQAIADASKVADMIRQRCGEAIFGYVDQLLCVLVAARSGQPRGSVSTTAAQQLERILQGQNRPCAAVSGTVRAAARLPSAMAETRMSLTIAASLAPAGPVVRTRSTAVERMLLRHNDPEALRNLVDETLGPIAEPGQEELLATLQTLVACAGSKSDAARRLHLRRQSVYYRLQRISELLDIDLDDPGELALLTTVFAARRTLQLARGATPSPSPTKR